MIYDTTFVIHLEREFRRKQTGDATAFLQAHPRDVPHISIVTVAEFAEGFEPHQRAACDAALKLYTVLDLDRDVAWRAAQLSRQLGRSGRRSETMTFGLPLPRCIIAWRWSPATSPISSASPG